MATKIAVVDSKPALRFQLMLMVIVALAGAAAVMVATRWGIGASPDSVTYLGVADNVGRGLAWTVPFGRDVGEHLTQFPPLYPAVLALLGEVVSDIGTGARVLQALSMAANTVLVACFLLRVSRGWSWVVGMTLMATAPSMVLIHSMAWSEPLFLLTGFTGLFFLASGLQQARAWHRWAAAVSIGLACLTRLAGAAFLLTGVIVSLLDPGTPKRRVSRAAAFGLIAGLPITAWLAWSAATADSLANRTVGVHLIGRDHLQQAVGTIASWLFVPANIPGLVKAIAIVTFGVGVVGLQALPGRKETTSAIDSPEARPPAYPCELRLLTVFCPTYVVVLAIATSFFDANVPWDDRILAPLLYSAVIITTAAIGRAMESSLAGVARQPPAWLRRAAILIACLWASGYAIRSAVYVVEAYTEGLGFRHQVWRESETLARLDALPEGLSLYSNFPEAIYLYTGRAARPLPADELRMPHRANPDFPSELAAMRQDLIGNGGVIAYFDAVSAASIPTLEELGEALGPVRVDRAADGAILTLEADRGVPDVHRRVGPPIAFPGRSRPHLAGPPRRTLEQVVINTGSIEGAPDATLPHRAPLCIEGTG